MANSIIYFEGIFMILTTTVPNAGMTQIDSIYLNSMFLMVFFIYYCDQGLQILYLALVYGVVVFVMEPIFYKGSLMNESILSKSVYQLVLWMLMSVIGVIYLYVTKLHMQMKDTVAENMKLLDGMHEGLLILHKNPKTPDNQKIMFCNRPAQKLLKGAISLGGESSLFPGHISKTTAGGVVVEGETSTTSTVGMALMN